VGEDFDRPGLDLIPLRAAGYLRPEVDFIADINPYGDKEATGLVTRFTVKKPKTPPGFPVFLRLLTQSDLIKILANSYFSDADQQEARRHRGAHRWA
jgi:hypothetical protein